MRTTWLSYGMRSELFFPQSSWLCLECDWIHVGIWSFVTSVALGLLVRFIGTTLICLYIYIRMHAPCRRWGIKLILASRRGTPHTKPLPLSSICICRRRGTTPHTKPLPLYSICHWFVSPFRSQALDQQSDSIHFLQNICSQIME